VKRVVTLVTAYSRPTPREGCIVAKKLTQASVTFLENQVNIKLYLQILQKCLGESKQSYYDIEEE